MLLVNGVVIRNVQVIKRIRILRKEIVLVYMRMPHAMMISLLKKKTKAGIRRNRRRSRREYEREARARAEAGAGADREAEQQKKKQEWLE